MTGTYDLRMRHVETWCNFHGFQTSSTTQTAGKPLANRILRNFHHVPNSLSEYAGHSNFEPRLVLVHLALSCCVSVMFISFKNFQSMAEKVRGGVDEPAT